MAGYLLQLIGGPVSRQTGGPSSTNLSIETATSPVTEIGEICRR
jgi:hypothetical protein